MDLSDIDLASVRRLRKGEFRQLREMGFFQDERVELLHGLVVRMTLGPRHEEIVERLLKQLILGIGDRARVRCASSLVVNDDYSEPEPDLLVFPHGDYEDSLPDRALLVIEVSDSSTRTDRRVKSALYAAAGVQEYWIISVQERCLEIHEEPADGAWKRFRRVQEGETVAPKAFPDMTIEIATLLPRP